MKKLILSLAVLTIGVSGFSQNYTDIKNLVILKKLPEAKAAFEKALAEDKKDKFKGKAETYALKAIIYSQLAADNPKSPESVALTNEANAALEKYKEMDPGFKLLLNNQDIYYNAPILIYGNYFNQGLDAYNKKNYQESFDDFKKVVSYSDFLIANKMTDMVLDTNAVLLAGASAQSLKQDDVAAKYFEKLANAKVGGKENEFLYHFLAANSMKSLDFDGFNKYIKLGREVFPGDKNFDYDDVDYILQVTDPELKSKLIAKKSELDPLNVKLQETIATDIFDKLNSKEEGATLPENADELEKQMVAAFLKSAQANPKNGFPYSNLANHFINKNTKVAKEQEAFREKVRAANAAKKPAKPGVKVAEDPEITKEREALKVKYNESLDQALEYFEKAVNVYSKLETPTTQEKQQWRNAVSYLIDLNAEKKNASKLKPADYNKYEKEENKWKKVYDTLSY
ncbi:hypothetical protein [Polluticaenibacter yanchengensis]|uniref:Tetratricopeptide repeat protein n=1 Tax=Polluticaenibacter yanchengensis TaxID=3014562 RepID=A0ABT4UHU2_9BACT|nr:hypothetical protein [Chitinophagaceae bacterium LY-5]